MRELLSKDNLIKYGFLNPAVDETPKRMARKRPVTARAPKASLKEKARGKRPIKESMDSCDASPWLAFIPSNLCIPVFLFLFCISALSSLSLYILVD